MLGYLVLPIHVTSELVTAIRRKLIMEVSSLSPMVQPTSASPTDQIYCPWSGMLCHVTDSLIMDGESQIACAAAPLMFCTTILMCTVEYARQSHHSVRDEDVEVVDQGTITCSRQLQQQAVTVVDHSPACRDLVHALDGGAALFRRAVAVINQRYTCTHISTIRLIAR